MSYPLRDRIRTEIENRRSREAIVDVRQLASHMAQEIDGRSSTAEIMLQRLIIDECSRAGINMRVGGSQN